MKHIKHEPIKLTGASGDELVIDVNKEGLLTFKFSSGPFYTLLDTKKLFRILNIMLAGKSVEADYIFLTESQQELKVKIKATFKNCTLSIIEKGAFPPHEFKQEPLMTLQKDQIIALVEFLSRVLR